MQSVVLAVGCDQIGKGHGHSGHFTQIAHPALGRLEVRRIDHELLRAGIVDGGGANSLCVAAVRDLRDGQAGDHLPVPGGVNILGMLLRAHRPDRIVEQAHAQRYLHRQAGRVAVQRLVDVHQILCLGREVQALDFLGHQIHMFHAIHLHRHQALLLVHGQGAGGVCKQWITFQATPHIVLDKREWKESRLVTV